MIRPQNSLDSPIYEAGLLELLTQQDQSMPDTQRENMNQSVGMF